MTSDVTPVVAAAGGVQGSTPPAPAEVGTRPDGAPDAPVSTEIDHLDAHAAPRTTGVPDEPMSRTPPPTAVATPPSGRRVRARLARLTATKPGAMPAVLEPLVKTIRAAHPKAARPGEVGDDVVDGVVAANVRLLTSCAGTPT